MLTDRYGSLLRDKKKIMDSLAYVRTTATLF